MAAFDRRMPRLLAAIERESRFREKPVGPAGLYVTLREQKWLHIIETMLGGTLNAFVVTNYEDSDVLKKLMREVGLYFPPLICSFSFSHTDA